MILKPGPDALPHLFLKGFRAPAAGTGYFLVLGDTTHADDSTNATPGHGHALGSKY